MDYLTPHDLVWVNNLVTGRIQRFDYVTLEAAIAGQYRFGESHNVLLQAAILLERMLVKTPFAAGNRRTALIATLTFLQANGYALKVEDLEAARIVLELAQGRLPALEAMELLAAPAPSGLPSELTLRKLIIQQCHLHAGALQALTPGD